MLEPLDPRPCAPEDEGLALLRVGLEARPVALPVFLVAGCVVVVTERVVVDLLEDALVVVVLTEGVLVACRVVSLVLTPPLPRLDPAEPAFAPCPL